MSSGTNAMTWPHRGFDMTIHTYLLPGRSCTVDSFACMIKGFAHAPALRHDTTTAAVAAAAHPLWGMLA